MQKINGRSYTDAVDAVAEKRLLILPKHVRKADVTNPQSCVLAQCLLQDHHVSKVHILQNTAYVTDKEGKTQRYILSPQTKLAICQFDKTGKWPVPGDGVHVVLRAPTGVRRLTHLRSKEMTKLRRKSYVARKNKPKRLRRTTDGISAEAIRSGVGYRVK